MFVKLNLLNEKEILLKNKDIDQTKEECVENFNKYNCVTSTTRLIIVGTITPQKGIENGYFYTAPNNRVYGLIDEAINTNLVQLKKALSKTTSPEEKAKIVNQIKSTLKEKGIAFLDIMKYVIRKKGSADDNDIMHYCLDVKNFKNVDSSVYFICNSKLAEKGYLNICKELQREPNYIYLPQHYISLYKNNNRSKWIEKIKEHSI